METSTNKRFKKNNFNSSSDWIKDEIFWNKELWESKHMMDAKWGIHHILEMITTKNAI